MLLRSFLLSAALALGCSGVASAQGPTYGADTPTKGALFRDGSSERYLLGGSWLYRADQSDSGVAQGLWRGAADTSGWSPVTVPNAYNAGDFSRSSMAGYVGWYRKDFQLPAAGLAASASKLRWIIRFESVNYDADVWLNGREIGRHAGAYLPFELDLNGLVAGVNRLIVRVENYRTHPVLTTGGRYIDGGPQGAWWNFGGILREVYLRPVNRADLATVSVRTILPCPACPATIQEQAVVRNVTSTPQPVRLSGFYGGAFLDFGTTTIAPHSSWTARAAVPISHPRLWSLSSPNLYRASLTLMGPHRERLAGYVTYSGVRSISVTGDGHLSLNGRVLNLAGVGLHETNVQLGAALDSAHRRQLIAWVRDLGGTVIRAHYPLHPEIAELADRYGILLWNEIPVYQVQTPFLANAQWRSSARAMLSDDIVANQNHPSVMLWSVGNELPTPASGAEAGYVADAAALARSLDPTRPVAMAVSDWPGVGCQRAYAPLDVLGVNEYFGWYDVGGGSMTDRDLLGPFLDTVRACYPHKALFVTEFGFEANRSGPVEERGTYEFQANTAAYHLGVFAHKPWLSGVFYWALQDFVLGPGWSGGNPWPDPPFFHKGLIDLGGNPKPAFAVVQAAFRAIAQLRSAPSSLRGRGNRSATDRPQLKAHDTSGRELARLRLARAR